MQLQDGKKYRTRDGTVVRVVDCHEAPGGTKYPFKTMEGGQRYAANGQYFYQDDRQRPNDLIEEVNEAPASSEGTPILPDTSRYTNAIDRARALILCKEAQDAGKVIQASQRGFDDWAPPPYRGWVFGADELDYRVKPEPVRSTRREWRVIVNIGDVGVYSTREAALACLGRMYGEGAIYSERVYLEDGVEVGRSAWGPQRSERFTTTGTTW